MTATKQNWNIDCIHSVLQKHAAAMIFNDKLGVTNRLQLMDTSPFQKRMSIIA